MQPLNEARERDVYVTSPDGFSLWHVESRVRIFVLSENSFVFSSCKRVAPLCGRKLKLIRHARVER